MTFYVLTLFPQTFSSTFTQSIIKRAVDNKIIKIKTINIRDFAKDKHKTVDDRPYGGGKGMILKVDVVVRALESIKPKPYSILLSASGKKYNQRKAREYSKKKSLAIVCGHYEGVDARVEQLVDEVISIGDYILTGGEIDSMAIIDSTARLLPKVINPDSLKTESFAQGSTLEYPQYPRPQNFRNLNVPKILLKGNHQQIKLWREKETNKRLVKLKPIFWKKINKD